MKTLKTRELKSKENESKLELENRTNEIKLSKLNEGIMKSNLKREKAIKASKRKQ